MLKELKHPVEVVTDSAEIRRSPVELMVRLQNALREIQGRPEWERLEAIDKMEADIKRMSDAMQEQDRIIKANSRTFDASRPGIDGIRVSSWLKPEDPGTDINYFNLMHMSSDELKHGIRVFNPTKAYNPFGQRVAFTERQIDAVDRLHAELQELNDQLLIADMVMCGGGQTAYARRSGDPATRMKHLKLWTKWEERCKEFMRPLAVGTAGSGGAWVPNQLSARLYGLIQPELRVAALFGSIDMPNNTFDFPVLGKDFTAYFIAESGAITDDSATLVTNKVTLTAKKLATRVISSTEVLEDSAIALEPFIVTDMSKGISRAIEDTCVNGDTDTGTGSASDYDAQSFATSHNRAAWDGLREHAVISGMPNVDLDNTGTSKFTIGNFMAIRKGMGPFGFNSATLAWIVGFKGWALMVTASETPGTIPSVFLSVEKYGQNATIMTGEVGQLLGSPVILTEFMREDLASTGKNTMAGPNTLTALLCVNRESFVMGRRRDIQIQRGGEVLMANDQILFVGTFRGQFRFIYNTGSAANKTVGIGRNFS